MPGPDSALFTDVTTVISPVVVNREPCQRCGDPFDPDTNGPDRCVFHAREDGTNGEFRILSEEELEERHSCSEDADVDTATGKWTCCGATHETAPGCCARPHVAKEVMVSVRAKSNAPVSVSGFEVHTYQILEISIFPGANYKLVIKLTRDIAELFHSYFLNQVRQVDWAWRGP